MKTWHHSRNVFFFFIFSNDKGNLSTCVMKKSKHREGLEHELMEMFAMPLRCFLYFSMIPQAVSFYMFIIFRLPFEAKQEYFPSLRGPYASFCTSELEKGCLQPQISSKVYTWVTKFLIHNSLIINSLTHY